MYVFLLLLGRRPTSALFIWFCLTNSFEDFRFNAWKLILNLHEFDHCRIGGSKLVSCCFSFLELLGQSQQISLGTFDICHGDPFCCKHLSSKENGNKSQFVFSLCDLCQVTWRSGLRQLANYSRVKDKASRLHAKRMII